jgi:nucleoside recognition membrane protein YjiH
MVCKKSATTSVLVSQMGQVVGWSVIKYLGSMCKGIYFLWLGMHTALQQGRKQTQLQLA